MVFPVVIPVNIDIDQSVDVILFSCSSKVVMQESFQAFLEGAEFPHGLRMMDAGPDVFLVDVVLAVFSNGLVLPGELCPVIGQQIVVPYLQECFHSFDDGGVPLIVQSDRPSSTGIVILHGQQRDAVEHGEI